MRLLDRYILTNFLVPFLLCFFGFLGIWFVFDLRENLPEFIVARVSAQFVARFYLTQLPEIMLISLPIGLLLALLYSLSKMSRSNEIIAMLTAGKSLTRLLLPLFLVGLLLTGVSTVLNYRLAPHAAAVKKQLLNEIGRKRNRHATLEEQLFRNRGDYRTWYVARMPANAPDTAELNWVHITQQDPDGNIKTKWYARTATFNAETKTWRLVQGKTVQFDRDGNIVSDIPWQTHEIGGWSETPWRIASSNLDPQYLSVPELCNYLRFNSDFPEPQLAPYRTQLHYRWALPWSCLVVVFLAGPLGIVYSRRGVLSGVAGAIFLFAFMMFSTFLMLALGKGFRVSAIVAAWSPYGVFFLIGAVLLYFRATNRDVPKLRELLRFR